MPNTKTTWRNLFAGAVLAVLATGYSGCASTGSREAVDGPSAAEASPVRASARQDGKGIPNGVSDGPPITTLPAPSAEYGHDPAHPIRVGGGMGAGGSKAQRRYLEGLAGPEGQTISYERAGSCCPYERGDGWGLLDVYDVSWEGGSTQLYLSLYEEEELYVPQGLTARQP